MKTHFECGLNAFPDADYRGMTLRDYFAAKAMQADMSTYSEDLIYETSEWFEARATQWYAVADAILKVRQA